MHAQEATVVTHFVFNVRCTDLMGVGATVGEGLGFRVFSWGPHHSYYSSLEWGWGETTRTLVPWR